MCSVAPPTGKAADSLYDRHGGEDAVRAVVGDFHDRMLADEDLAPVFADLDTDRLRERQTLHRCAPTGGPPACDGPSVRDSHLHRPTEPEHVERTVEHLDAALDARGVPDGEARDVLEAVGSFGEDLLARPDDE